jgi:sorting nexin-1/2
VRLRILSDRILWCYKSAFIARIKTYFNWQNAEAEARRIKVQVERERTKKGGKYAPDRSSMIDSEITQVSSLLREKRTCVYTDTLFQAERRVIDAQSDFEAVSRLIKLEYSRFEQERVEDFKSALERYVQGACESQREVRPGSNSSVVLCSRTDFSSFLQLVAAWEKFHSELGELVGQADSARL